MKFIVLVCILAFAAAEELKTNTGKNCNTALTAVTVNSFNVTPWPPIKNKDLGMVMNATFNQAETTATMEIYVKYQGSAIFHESVKEVGTYKAGQVGIITFSTFLPSIAPSGSYEVDSQLTNTAGTVLNCWAVFFTL